MKRGESQAPDAIFGQSRAFALSDSSVNPDVIEYLKSVRQEALRTNAISIKNHMNLQRGRVTNQACTMMRMRGPLKARHLAILD